MMFFFFFLLKMDLLKRADLARVISSGLARYHLLTSHVFDDLEKSLTDVTTIHCIC